MRVSAAQLAVDMIRCEALPPTDFTSKAEEIFVFLTGVTEEEDQTDQTNDYTANDDDVRYDNFYTINDVTDVAKRVQDGIAMWLNIVDKYLNEKTKK